MLASGAPLKDAAVPFWVSVPTLLSFLPGASPTVQSSAPEFRDPHGEWRLSESGRSIVRICRNQTSLTLVGATKPANDRFPHPMVICASRSIGSFGLVLCFSYRSAKIEPLPVKPVLASTGGGWIDMGLVVMDRFRVWSAAVFA